MIHPLHVLTVAAAFIAAMPSALGQELNGQVEASLANHKLTGSKVGVSVVDLETGRELVDLRDEEALIPASNMKLLTSGAALLVLGHDFVFRTELILDGTRLILRGSGDPALGDPFILEKTPTKLTVDGMISALAGSVKTTSGGPVSEIIIDDRIFDRQWVHPTWPVAQLDKWYCAEVSGVNFHTNVISLFPSPATQAGRPPGYSLEPSVPWMEIENKARTVAGSKNTVWLGREPDSNRLTMFGEVAIPTRIPVEITLHEVPLFAGKALAAELPRAGVGVGDVRPLASPESRLTREQATSAFTNVRFVSAGETLEGRTIAVVTTSIEDVIERCNGDSQNLYAECMLKRMGHEVTHEPGSWTNGASVLRMKLAELPPKGLGPDCAASTQIADGSGMSREDRVAPRTLTKWLDRMQRDSSCGAMFVNSLASPTHKQSLKKRFADRKLLNELRGKTGTIDGVRCFSGYLTDPKSGRRVAFSVMVNNLKEGEQALQALDFHEEVVVIADKWLAARRGSRPAAAVPQMGGDR